MLLPTLISLIEMFLPSALSIAEVLYLESKIEFRALMKLDGINCIIIIVNVLLKFNIFFFQLSIGTNHRDISSTCTWLCQ